MTSLNCDWVLGGDSVEYSPLGNGKPISQKVSGNCVETTFERTNGLKSEYDISEKNKVLKECVEKVVITGDDIDIHFSIY